MFSIDLAISKCFHTYSLELGQLATTINASYLSSVPNRVVYEKAQESDELRDMGTTLDICLVYNNRVFIGHVGDSRVYRIRKDVIRKITNDHSYVEKLVREAFWNVYRPGCLEHYVLNQLRNDEAFVPELDFVMERDRQLIGQNMFMRANIKADDGRDIPIMTMVPICITPELKRQGFGKKLLDYSLNKAAELGCGALCFEGNINFYGKSGFTFASEFGIRYHDLPEDADASFFLCKELIPGYLSGVTGEYTPPQGYFVDEDEAEEFDKGFSYKEKLKLPGQLF